jgi:hypothetical protein
LFRFEKMVPTALEFARGVGKHYDVEMDCATAAHGKLDTYVEQCGDDDEMNPKVSIVRTAPFTESNV